MDEFLSLLDTILTGRISKELTEKCHEQLSASIRSLYPETDDISVSISVYDTNQYCAFQFIQDSRTICEVEIDMSNQHNTELLIEHFENGRYYCRRISIYMTQDEFQISSAFYGSSFSSYRRMTYTQIVAEETVWLKKSRESEREILYTFSFGNETDSVIFSGTAQEDGRVVQISGFIPFSRTNGVRLLIDARIEPEVDKEIYASKAFTVEEDLILQPENRALFLSGLLGFLSNVLPYVPESYQTALFSLIME